MNILHSDYFLAIAEHGNLSDAAKALRISQPVLSRYLINLEHTLGIKLFIRADGGYRLTEAGTIYLSGARRIQTLHARLRQSISDWHGDTSSPIRLGLSPIHGGAELAYIYPRMLERFPAVKLRPVYGNSRELLDLLLREKVDVISGIFPSAARLPGVQLATLLRQRILLAIPPLHPLFQRGGQAEAPHPFPMEELPALTQLPFILMTEDTILGRSVQELLHRLPIALQVQLETSNGITNRLLLQSGSYAGFIAESSAEALNPLRFFYFPEEPPLYSALLFRSAYIPSEAERYLYTLESERENSLHPILRFENKFGKSLLSAEQRVQRANLL